MSEIIIKKDEDVMPWGYRNMWMLAQDRLDYTQSGYWAGRREEYYRITNGTLPNLEDPGLEIQINNLEQFREK